MLEKYRHVGKRLQRERLNYGLSLSEVAEATGLSTSFLSLLENGKVVPSLKALDKLCTFFSIHMATLFEEEDNEQEILFFPREKQIEVSMKGERDLRFLLPKRKPLEPVLITLHPQSTSQEFTIHKGIEFGYVLEGTIEVHLKGQDPIICKSGDSILYRADLPHRLTNPTREVARGIWIGLRESNSL